MKKRLSLLTALVLTITMPFSGYAQTGATCDDAIYVESEYSGEFTAGEYWFMAMTSSLPVSIKCYPQNQGATAPEILVDFTCTYKDGKPVYDDEKVERMITHAADYGLTVPMTYKLSPSYDENGKIFYNYTFARNYRSMLYGQGVTYAIPAFVRLKVFSTCSVQISSESINARCVDYVNQLGMNTTLLFSPEDSINTYVWPVGEWIKYKYDITWSGKDTDSRLLFITSKDCEFDRFSGKVRDRFYLPAVDEAHELKMTPEASSDLVEEIFQTELYVRMYTSSEGYLKISTYEDKDNLTDYVVAGVAAVVDNDNMTISAVLPVGTDRNTAISAARYRPLETHDGYSATYNASYTTLTFGALKYDLTGIVVAQKTGDTDASLKSLSINGIALPDFSPAVLDYQDIEVQGDTVPLIEAQARKATSQVQIEQATAIPGKATITVTAEAGNTQVYTVNLIRQRSKDNTLSALYVDGKLIEGFSRDIYHYRMSVTHLPVISAEVNDPKSKMVLDQCKHVPGFAQVIITAEAGNTEVYTINFSVDPEIIECQKNTKNINLNEPVSIDEGKDYILSFPAEEWGQSLVQFEWSGSTNMDVDISTSCVVNAQSLVGSFTIKAQKGVTGRIYYFRKGEMQELTRKSIDGNLYLIFTAPTAGQLNANNYEADCRNRSLLLDLPDTIDVAADYTASTIYKIYAPDWRDKGVRFTWESENKVDIYIAPCDCDFYLDPNSNAVRQGMIISMAGNSQREFSYEDINDLLSESALKYAASEIGEMCKEESKQFLFIKMRKQRGQAGVLSTEIISVKPSDEQPTDLTDGTESSFTQKIMVDQTGKFTYRAKADMQLSVYDVTGRLLSLNKLTQGEKLMLDLTAGIYILKGERL
mgnify:CR=1 FL=1